MNALVYASRGVNSAESASFINHCMKRYSSLVFPWDPTWKEIPEDTENQKPESKSSLQELEALGVQLSPKLKEKLQKPVSPEISALEQEFRRMEKSGEIKA